MLNQVILVGRLVDDVKVEEVEGKTRTYITLAVSRSYKNANGEYETDFVDCVLWSAVAENTAEYCHKGDVIGVKGRIETYVKDDVKKTNIVADKVTFLSSKEKED